MPIKILSDLVDVVSEHISNPGTSGFEIFVGLEHYDSGDPVITRYGSTNNLASSVKHFVSGDILVARRNVYLRRAGVVRFEGVTSGDSIVLRVKDKKYSGILPFILNTDDFWDYAEQNSDGTMSKRLAPDVLLEYECNIPDNHYQIANKLWAAYHLKESYKRLLTATDEMVKSQFIEMYSKAHKKMTLESVCTIMGKGITPKYVDSSSVVVINQACIHWDGQHLENVKYHNKNIPIKKRSLETGDVLLNATGNGTLGRCCVFNCPSDENQYVNDGHVIALSTDKSVILPEVLNSYLSLSDTQSEIYRQYVTGSTNQIDIVFTDIKKMTVPVPNMREQLQFVSILQQADKSKFELRKSIDAIDQVIKSLING